MLAESAATRHYTETQAVVAVLVAESHWMADAWMMPGWRQRRAAAGVDRCWDHWRRMLSSAVGGGVGSGELAVRCPGGRSRAAGVAVCRPE